MLSLNENEVITRTGPSDPMGDVMRRYWLPTALSSELPEADCPPVRVKLLGESLVAFRDSGGRVGLLGEFCAHRRASLFLGRNEEGGLRCVYHGWKYDVAGRCMDMPNEPAEYDFKHKVHVKAYPTVEAGGLIWAYIGPKDKIPALPKFEWTQVPQSQRYVTKTWQECNWLQALEGGIDSSHASFLHQKLTEATAREGMSLKSIRMRSSLAAKVEVKLTDYGFLCATIRSHADGGNFVLIHNLVMPFHQLRASAFAGNIRESMIEGHMWVPMDDENCMDYTWICSLGGDLSREEVERIESHRGRGQGERTADFRKVRNKDNLWLIDRHVQKKETFTGIEGVNAQDHAIQESMGPIVDRTQEHLGNTDKGIIALRRFLIQAAKAVQAGFEPPGTSPDYDRIRPIGRLVPSDMDWRSLLPEVRALNNKGGENAADS